MLKVPFWRCCRQTQLLIGALPGVLLEVHEGTGVDFHCGVLPIRLAVGLRVEGGGDSSLGA